MTATPTIKTIKMTKAIITKMTINNYQNSNNKKKKKKKLHHISKNLCPQNVPVR